MCTVGGGPDIGNIESLVANDYDVRTARINSRE